jgi:hypothetical protein
MKLGHDAWYCHRATVHGDLERMHRKAETMQAGEIAGAAEFEGDGKKLL